MSLSWLPNTSSGVMVGDYTAVTFANGHAYAVFAVARASSGATFDEAIYANTERAYDRRQPVGPHRDEGSVGCHPQFRPRAPQVLRSGPRASDSAAEEEVTRRGCRIAAVYFQSFVAISSLAPLERVTFLYKVARISAPGMGANKRAAPTPTPTPAANCQARALADDLPAQFFVDRIHQLFGNIRRVVAQVAYHFPGAPLRHRGAFPNPTQHFTG